MKRQTCLIFKSLEVINKEENGLKTYPRIDQCFKKSSRKGGKDVGTVVQAIISKDFVIKLSPDERKYFRVGDLKKQI